MLPNIHPPVDRSEKTRQQHVKHRASQQSFRGAVGTSDWRCDVCCFAAYALPWPWNNDAKKACHAAMPGCYC